MSAAEIIAAEPGGGLSFGDHTSTKKLKSNDFEVNGVIYKVKSHHEITRAEKNGKLLYESVPGTSVRGFFLDDKNCRFSVIGFESTQITVELEPETEYRIYIDEINVGESKSNLSSKFNFSVELFNTYKDVRIERL